jgi:hypothetical protein
MDTQKQVIDRLKQANNVLVTVSNDPSVDQLAACIGLSLALNKLDKHATAVFSGNVPSTIEFLKPENTIEKNTDSLRDFIISLDKSKADKLRYKVEDKLVRIFITPYRTSISDADLEFSQGDFNVDVVLAIGVHDQKALDQAVTAHGRILHDATVVTINNQEQGGELGSMQWLDTKVSSLSEMTAMLATALSKDVLDEQIATAFLTGIVAETDRFSNEKTSADTMNVSASLMAAGANQQLVATKLQEPLQAATSPAKATEDTSSEPDVHVAKDGTLEINHDNDEVPELKKEETPTSKPSATEEPVLIEEKPDSEPELPQISETKQTDIQDDTSKRYKNPRTAVSPPPFSSDTDPSFATKQEPYVDPLTLPPVPNEEPILNHETPVARDHSRDTLTDIEQEVNSPHLHTASSQPVEEPSLPSFQPPKPAANGPEELNLDDLQRPEGLDEPISEPPASVDAARDAVAAAMSDTDAPLEPISALNAQPLGGPLHATTQDSSAGIPQQDNTLPQSPLFAPTPSMMPSSPAGPDPSALPTADQPMTMPLPGVPQASTQDASSQDQDPNAAPPVPPPIVPPFPGQ